MHMFELVTSKTDAFKRLLPRSATQHVDKSLDYTMQVKHPSSAELCAMGRHLVDTSEITLDPA